MSAELTKLAEAFEKVENFPLCDLHPDLDLLLKAFRADPKAWNSAQYCAYAGYRAAVEQNRDEMEEHRVALFGFVANHNMWVFGNDIPPGQILPDGMRVEWKLIAMAMERVANARQTENKALQARVAELETALQAMLDHCAGDSSGTIFSACAALKNMDARNGKLYSREPDLCFTEEEKAQFIQRED